MLKTVCTVAKELSNTCGANNLTLEKITEMVTAITVIDHIFFVQYDTPTENPIWGEFTRWSKQPSAYSPFETLVEVRYAAHLLEKEDWLRFVVCKELCHALDAPAGKHDASERAIDTLVEHFSRLSQFQVDSNFSREYRLEIQAEVGAVELLCPLATRKTILGGRAYIEEEEVVAIAAEYNIPAILVPHAFRREHIAWIESVLSRT